MKNLVYYILLLIIFYSLYKIVHEEKVIYLNDEELLNRLKADLYKIDPRSANFNYYSSNESLTEDKKDIYLCLRDPDTGKYYDYNSLVLIACHEASHAVSLTVDENHTGLEFNNNYKMLLQRAIDLGLYDPNLPFVSNYCPLKKPLKK